MVEAALAPLAGPLGVQLGAAVARLHAEHGPGCCAGPRLRALPAATASPACELADGRRLPADVVVVGIGAVPNVEWLRGARSNWPTVWCVTRAGRRRSRTWLRSATVRPGMSRVWAAPPRRTLDRRAGAAGHRGRHAAGRAARRHAGQTSVLLVRPVRLPDPVRRHRRSRRRDHLRGRQRCTRPASWPCTAARVNRSRCSAWTSRGCSPRWRRQLASVPAAS